MWPRVPFAEAFGLVSDRGRRVKQKQYLNTGNIPVIDQGSSFVGGFTNDEAFVVEAEPPVIVFGDHTRRVKYVDFPFAVGADGVKLLKPTDRLLSKFAYWYLRSVDLTDRGYGRHFGLLRGIDVPVPSLDEQREVVDLVEDYLSRLDAAGDYLDASRRKLDALEQVALANCRAGELRPLAEVTAVQGGIQKQQKRAPKDHAFPFLRVANVTARGLDLGEVHDVELFDGELNRLRLQVGDLLVVEGNGSASQIGRAALWDGSIEDCVHQNHLIRVRPLDGLLPAYLEAVWNSPQNRATLSDVASSSSGLHTLSVAKLKALSIPVPSVDRQLELVATVDEIREAKARMASEIAAAASRRDALRRSLLSAAFSGRLSGTSADVSDVEELIGT